MRKPIQTFSTNALRWIVIILGVGLLYTMSELKKANTCNKAMRLWFYYHKGININMDKLYEDAKKWVNDPQYIPEDFK
jgi:hypothetical protein